MTQEKIFINNNPPLPAQCVVCYRTFKQGTVFLDFGMNVEFYGAILMCDDCITNAGTLIGLIPVAKADQTTLEWVTATDALVQANKKVRILESFVAAYSSDPDVTLDSFLASAPSLSLFDELEEGYDGDKSSGKVSKSEPVKSSAK